MFFSIIVCKPFSLHHSLLFDLVNCSLEQAPHLTCAFLSTLLAFIISKFLFRQIANRKELVKRRNIQIPAPFRLALLMFTAFILWNVFMNDFDVVHSVLNQFVDSLFTGGPVSPFEARMGELSASGISWFQTIKLFMYRYGGLCIYAVISVIAVATVFKASWSRKERLEPIDFTYAILFTVAVVISVFSLLGQTGEERPMRIVRFIMMVAPIVSGLVIYRFIFAGGLRRVSFARLILPRNVRIISVVLVLIITSMLCVFGTYGSPRTVTFNQQISRFDLTGSEWFITHQNEDIRIATDRVAIGRFRDLLLGTEGHDTYGGDWFPPYVPSHFAYDEQDSISDVLGCEDTYLLTNELGRTYSLYAPQNVRGRYPQYTDEDYSRLRSDHAVIQIYSSGEFEVWRVYG